MFLKEIIVRLFRKKKMEIKTALVKSFCFTTMFHKLFFLFIIYYFIKNINRARGSCYTFKIVTRGLVDVVAPVFFLNNIVITAFVYVVFVLSLVFLNCK